MEPSSAGQGKWRRQSERRTPNCRSDNPAQRCPSRDDGRDEFALDSCVDRSTAISTRVRLFRLFLLIPCWESQRLIPKRSAGPRATTSGVVSLEALDHHRPNREESAPTEAVVGVLRRQGLQPDSPCCFCPIVTNMAEYATASGSAEMVTPKNRLAGGEAPLLCRQHGIPQGPARADARRSTGRSPQRVIGTTPLFVMQIR